MLPLLRIIPELAVILSGSFWISLGILSLVFPSYLLNPERIAWGVALLVLILPKTETGKNILKIAGSLLFFLFWGSAVWYQDNFWGEVFWRYYEMLGKILNTGVIVVAILLVVILYFFIFSAYLVTTTTRLFRTSRVRVLVAGILLVLFLGVIVYAKRNEDFLFNILIQFSKLITPVLGFSLAYLHARVLMGQRFLNSALNGVRDKL